MVSTANSKRLLSLLLVLPAVAWAGDWKLTPTVSVGERYTDNVNLSTTGQESADWITEVSPQLSVRREGARLKVNADYSLQGLMYADDSSRSRIRHSLNGRANAELKEDWFYLDASARVSQAPQNLTSATSVGNDGVGVGNTSTVAGYSLSPYMKHRFGSIATVEARVSRDDVFTGQSGVSDSGTTQYLLSATSGNDFYPLSWSANYSNSDTSNDVGADTGSERAAANARYQLSRKFGLLAQASMEKNDFAGASNQVRDYSTYGLGAYYAPSRRISMDVYYNASDNGNFVSGSVNLRPTLRTNIYAASSKRAYGRSYSLNLSHRTRRSNWSLGYLDDLTTSQQQFNKFVGVLDYYVCTDGREGYLPHGVVPPDPATCTLSKVIGNNEQTQINETYLAKNLIGTVSYSLRRNTWLLSLYSNQRDFQVSGGSDTTRGVQGTWTLQYGPRTTFSLVGGMSQVESSTSALEDDLWNLGLTVSRKFQPKLTGSLEVRHQERDSNQASGDYAENAVAARLNMTF